METACNLGFSSIKGVFFNIAIIIKVNTLFHLLVNHILNLSDYYDKCSVFLIKCCLPRKIAVL